MPRFIGHYVGISFQAELLAITLLGLLNSTLEWYPFDWTHQVQKIWELSLSQYYFHFYTDFEYWIKSILTWIVITRKIVAYVYTFLYTVNFYPILTWSHPNLLLPWLILGFFQNFILKSIVIMIFLWLWSGERFSLIRTIEFILVEFLSLTTSAYVWYAVACSCIQLKRIEKIRRIRKTLQAKYSIAYDLFSSDTSSMEISKESSYGSFLGGHRHMSLPNLNEAFYRSIFSDNYNDNKLSRSLTTLSTINSFSDSEEFISQIVHNTDLIPAEKCMKMLGITDVDVINARARVRKRMLASCPLIEEKKKDRARIFAFEEGRKPRKNEAEKIFAIESREIKRPSIVDYLMTKTDIPETIFQDDDTPDETTLKEMDRKENFTIREQDKEIEHFTPDTETCDKKNEKSFIQTKKRRIVASEREEEFKCPPVTDFVTDRTDKNEETKLQFIEPKKKQKKVCPLTRELIETKPCFPLVGRRKFRECPFKKETVLSRSPFPCISARRNKHLNNANLIETDTIGSSSKDVPKDESTVDNPDSRDESILENNFVESKSSKTVTTMRELINKGSENYVTSKESYKMETLDSSNVPKELRLEPRRNFNHIFNSRSNVLPLGNVWSTIGCLPFRQKFNFTSLYGTEFQFDKSLFKPSSSQELLDRRRLITWKASSTELLVKVPEQVVCYTGIEYKPVAIPGTSNGTRFVKDELERLDSVNQDSIKVQRYTSIEYPALKGKLEDDNPFHVSQNILKEERNFNEDCDTRNNRKMISTQTTESLDNYNYEVVRVAENTQNYDMYGMDNSYPKFVSKMSTTSSLDHASNINDVLKNNSYSDIFRDDRTENEFCCCKDSYDQLINESLNTNLTQIEDGSKYAKTSYSNKPPAYPKKTKKTSLHRLTGVKNKVVKVSFESNKHLEHYDRSRHDVESSKRRKRVTSSIEKERLEMKALRAYNEITLLEDKREMGEKIRHRTEVICSFVDDTKGLKPQTNSWFKKQSKRQVQEKNDDEDSYNEIEIASTANSFFEYMTSFNNEQLLKDKDDVNSSKHEPSCSTLPNINNKDAAIMLNLLDRHGSQWFKQELEKILAIKTNQVNVRNSEPSHYALKFDHFLTSCQKIDDIRDDSKHEGSRGKENISILSGVPLSYNYLLTRSDLDANQNVTYETRDTMILNSMESTVSEVPITSVDYKDFTECTENNEVEEEERDTLTTTLLKEDKSKDTEIISNLSHPPTNLTPLSSCTRTHEDAMEPIDVSNHHEEVRRRNASLHMMDIARNISWTLRPNGIVLTNKNLQGQSFDSTNHRGSQQRDIIDDFTASLVHAAFSHKREIIIRTFSRDPRSTTDQDNVDERSAPIFDNIYNSYRLMETITEVALHADNEVSVSMEDTLTNIQTERNFGLSIVIVDDDLSLESISTSVDSLPGDEVVEHDSVELVTRSGETRKMDVTDPRIDSSEEEAMKNSQQPSLEMIIAFFSFLLACYSQYLRSYLSSMSDSSSSLYTYRPCEIHSDSAFKKDFLEKKSLYERLALSNSTSNPNVSEISVQSEDEEGLGVIEFTDEFDNNDEVSIESINQQVSSLHDSFDTMYSRDTVESENAISVGESSSMEEFS